MKMESSLQKKMELILSLLDELHEISIYQQTLLSKRDFEKLPATFEQRQVLFARLQAVKQAVDRELGEQSFESDPIVESYRQQCDSSLQRFLEADERVSSLLDRHLKQISFELFRRLKTKDAAQRYKRIEQATNRIAQVFPGESRHTDIQK
jgi:flagellar biosynthesis/type III secretory pathway chaperone